MECLIYTDSRWYHFYHILFTDSRHPFDFLFGQRDHVEGVSSVFSGYTGGRQENPSYREVSSGSSGHREAVQIVYDPELVSYERLLCVFWTQINPTDAGGQFVDRDKAIEHGKKMAADGAAIIDVGAESTRPGSKPVPTDEQIKRAIDVIKALSKKIDVFY